MLGSQTKILLTIKTRTKLRSCEAIGAGSDWQGLAVTGRDWQRLEGPDMEWQGLIGIKMCIIVSD